MTGILDFVSEVEAVFTVRLVGTEVEGGSDGNVMVVLCIGSDGLV